MKITVSHAPKFAFLDNVLTGVVVRREFDGKLYLTGYLYKNHNDETKTTRRECFDLKEFHSVYLPSHTKVTVCKSELVIQT